MLSFLETKMINHPTIITLALVSTLLLSSFIFPSCEKDNIIETVEENDEVTAILTTHLDKESGLYAIAYNYPFYYYPGKEKNNTGALYNKRLVFAWMSDVHGGNIEYGRFVTYSNHYDDVIDFMLVTGDLSELAPRDGGWERTQGYYAKKSKTPILIGLGNHDVTGNKGNEVVFDSLEEMDNELILPWKEQIKWTNKGEGSYYYKDFSGHSYSYRIIMLNDYERPRLVADGSWETISYDESLPCYTSKTTYEIGSKINYLSHSYRAVTKVQGIAPSRFYFDFIDGRYISKEQAEWLCSALSTMPLGYRAIICTHMMIGKCKPVESNFTYKNGNTTGFEMCQNGHVLLDIINAYNERSSLSKTYEMTKRTTGGDISGEVIKGFGYSLNYDFSSVPLNNRINCCLTGHNHFDMVAILCDSYPHNIYNLMITAGASTFQCGDIGNFGEYGKDSFNIVSVDNNSELKMMRIGSNLTSDFVERDFISLCL